MAGICRWMGGITGILGFIGTIVAAVFGAADGGLGGFLLNLLPGLVRAAVLPVVFFALAEGLDVLKYLAETARAKDERERLEELEKERENRIG